MTEEESKRLEEYLKGQSNSDILDWITNVFSDGRHNEKLKKMLFNDWNDFKEIDNNTGEKIENILDKLHHSIYLNELKKRKKPLQKIRRIYLKVAAILLLPALLTILIQFNTERKKVKETFNFKTDAVIYAPMGSRVAFSLPDGTSGMLNSGSYLSYSLPFTKLRKILLSGEAWFEVISDPGNPFIISAGNSTIKATGTKFNLSAYPSDDYIELVLNEGRVEFIDDSTAKLIILKPFERVVSKNGVLKKTQVDPEKYQAWTEGKLVFKNDTMAEVVRRLERWYNIKITLADKELENYSFRATFQDDPIEEVLRFLALTSPIDYKINPRIIDQDGSYKKQEITIFKN